MMETRTTSVSAYCGSSAASSTGSGRSEAETVPLSTLVKATSSPPAARRGTAKPARRATASNRESRRLVTCIFMLILLFNVGCCIFRAVARTKYPRDVPACSCVTLPIFCGLCLQYTTLCTNCQPLSRRIQGQHFLFPSWRGSAPGFPPGRAQSAMGFHHCEGNTLRFCRFCLPVSHGHSSSASLRWAPSPGEGKALLGRKCAEVSQNSF